MRLLFSWAHHYYTLNGLSERETAHSLRFEVFIDDHDVHCFAGDSTLKSKFANLIQFGVKFPFE